MPADETIRVGLDFDLGDAQQKLDAFKSTFESLKQSFQDAPSATRAFNQGLDRSLELVDLMQKKINKANESGNVGDSTFQKDVSSGISELDALSKLFSNGGSFNVSSSRNMFSGFSAAVQKELDSVTKDITNIFRTNIRSLKTSTVAGITEQMLNLPDMQELFGTKIKNSRNGEFEKYVKALVPHMTPAYLLGDYNQIRYGTMSGRDKVSRKDIIPASFRSSYDNKGYVGIAKPENGGIMQVDYRNILKNLIMENDAALRAAESTSGMLRYKKNGKASLAYDITPEMYDAFRSKLFGDFVRRASGSASNRVDIFDEQLEDSEVRKLINRMTGGSTGRVLRAMDRLEGLHGDNLWGSSSIKKGYEDLDRVAKRTLEQYEVAKYNFGDLYGGKNKSSRVMLSESQNTRMLGLSGHHNEFTDKVLLVSADGYDKTDPRQQAYIESLLSGKPVEIPGTDKKYIGQNIHGTGGHTVIRMVEAQAYEKVRKQEEEWAKKNGFITSDGKGANYWNDFIPEDYDFKEIKDLRKHYDATGKGWSPGYKMQTDFSGRKFGIIDLSKIGDDNVRQKLADGLGWFTGGSLSVRDFQGRMGVAGKGTFHRLSGYRTLGEWAQDVGLANESGRFILPGPRGDVDLTDMSGMADASTVKNLQAYDKFKTPEAYNQGFTKMLQRYGMSVMESYEDAETRARGIGSQAMAFIKLSPKMQDAQIKEYTRRMHLLDTEAGVKEYLLSDPDNYLANKVRIGEMNVNDPAIQSWVRAERESLANRFAAGEWIDFGDQPSVVNQMANKSPISSIIGFKNAGDKSTILKEIRTAYKNKTKNELTLSDEDLAGIFALNAGQIVDFARPGEDRVSVVRSPSGFGNFVAGKNYASLAKPIYEALGISTNGVYLSEPDMFKLGGADFDGDKVKTAYGDIGAAIEEAAKVHDEAIKILGQVSDPVTKAVELEGVTNYKDSNLHRRLYTESAVAGEQAMGGASSSGMRAAMVDLYNPKNRDFLIAAIQSNAAYRDTTAQVKSATETITTDEMKKALYLGAQWSKLPTKYERFFNVTGRNDVEIPNEEDVILDDNGVKINLNELRKVDFDKINTRSVYSGADLGSLRGAMAVSKQFGVDMRRPNALLRALDQYIGYGDAGEKTRALMQNMRTMKVMDLVSPGAIMSDEELDNLSVMVAQAEEEVKKQAYNLSKGQKIKMDDGSEVSYSSYVSKKLNEYGISSAKAFIERGIHARSLRNVYGDQAASLFPEFFDPSNVALELPNRAEETLLRLANPEEQQKIVEEKEEQIKKIDQQIADRKQQIENIQKQKPEDPTLAQQASDLDAKILEERTRLKQDRTQLVQEALADMNGWQERRIQRGHEQGGHSVTSVTSMIPWMQFGDNNIVPFQAHTIIGPEVDANPKYRGYRSSGIVPVGLFDENGPYGQINQMINDIAGVDKPNQDSVMGTLLHAAVEAYGWSDKSKNVRDLFFETLEKNPEMLKSVGLSYNKETHQVSGFTDDEKITGNTADVRERKYRRAIGYNANWEEESQGALSYLMDKVFKGTDEEIVNIEGKNILVDGSKGSELSVNVPGWESTVSRPDFITRHKNSDTYTINDLKSSFAGGTKGLVQMMLYAKQYEDAAKKAWGIQDDGTFDLSKADKNSEYAKFGYVDDEGKFHSKITGLRALSANGSIIEANAQQTIQDKTGNQVRLMDVLSEAYQDAVKVKHDVFDKGGSDVAVSKYISQWLAEKKGVSLSPEDVAGVLNQSINPTSLTSDRLSELQQQRNNLGKTQEEIGLEQEVARLQQQKDAAEQQKNNAAAEMKKTYDYIAAQEQYSALTGRADEFTSNLYSSIQRKEQRLAETPQAELYYNKNIGQARSISKSLEAFSKTDVFNQLPVDFQQDVLERINGERSMMNMVEQDFADTAEYKAKQLADKYTTANKKQGGPASLLDLKFEQYDKELKIAEEYRDKLAKNIQDNSYTDEQKADFQKQLESTNQYLAEARKQEEELKKTERAHFDAQMQYNRDRQVRRDDQLIAQSDRFKMNRPGAYSTMLGGRIARQIDNEILQRQSYGAQLEDRLAAAKLEQSKYTDGNGNVIEAQRANYEKAAADIERFNAAIKANQSDIQSLQSGLGGLGVAFGVVSQSVERLMMRLGRQMLMKAFNEAKKFIKEFDASMNEIQAITLKSPQDMESIRSRTISKAQNLRTSVSNVATTEAALYRQGLSDQEVSSRTDAIIKFATVTKINVAEATKIITTALQNDLVPSAEAAMDALVALGDSAATTAAEIGKGMQKAAASAKVAGVSYAELTALLTIGTSDTQLSGTQVGTALQTVFTRMRRISTSGFVADQNGKKTTISDTETALKAIGVDLFEDRTQGKMRSAYDILRDIAGVWEDLSDIQKSLVTGALAGTRQTNIFSTLMEGMSEDGGATLDKYLGLADGSTGITQSKYEIAMESLAAHMDAFKSSFDGMVESLVNNGLITGVIDGLGSVFNFISGIADTNGGQIGIVFGAIAAGLIAVATAAKFSIPIIGPILALITALAGGAVVGGLFGGIGGLLFNTPQTAEQKAAQQREKDWERVQEDISIRSDAQNKRQAAVDNVQKLGEAYDKVKDSQDSIAKMNASMNLTAGLEKLKNVFPEVSGAIETAMDNLYKWTDAVDAANKAGQKYLKDNARKDINKAADYLLEHGQAEYEAVLNAGTVTSSNLVKMQDALGDKFTTVNNTDWQNYIDGLKESGVDSNSVYEIFGGNYAKWLKDTYYSGKSERASQIDALQDSVDSATIARDKAIANKAALTTQQGDLETRLERIKGTAISDTSIDPVIAELLTNDEFSSTVADLLTNDPVVTSLTEKREEKQQQLIALKTKSVGLKKRKSVLWDRLQAVRKKKDDLFNDYMTNKSRFASSADTSEADALVAEQTGWEEKLEELTAAQPGLLQTQADKQAAYDELIQQYNEIYNAPLTDFYKEISAEDRAEIKKKADEIAGKKKRLTTAETDKPELKRKAEEAATRARNAEAYYGKVVAGVEKPKLTQSILDKQRELTETQESLPGLLATARVAEDNLKSADEEKRKWENWGDIDEDTQQELADYDAKIAELKTEKADIQEKIKGYFNPETSPLRDVYFGDWLENLSSLLDETTEKLISIDEELEDPNLSEDRRAELNAERETVNATLNELLEAEEDANNTFNKEFMSLLYNADGTLKDNVSQYIDPLANRVMEIDRLIPDLESERALTLQPIEEGWKSKEAADVAYAEAKATWDAAQKAVNDAEGKIEILNSQIEEETDSLTTAFTKSAQVKMITAQAAEEAAMAAYQAANTDTIELPGEIETDTEALAGMWDEAAGKVKTKKLEPFGPVLADAEIALTAANTAVSENAAGIADANFNLSLLPADIENKTNEALNKAYEIADDAVDIELTAAQTAYETVSTSLETTEASIETLTGELDDIDKQIKEATDQVYQTAGRQILTMRGTSPSKGSKEAIAKLGALTSIAQRLTKEYNIDKTERELEYTKDNIKEADDSIAALNGVITDNSGKIKTLQQQQDEADMDYQGKMATLYSNTATNLWNAYQNSPELRQFVASGSMDASPVTKLLKNGKGHDAYWDYFTDNEETVYKYAEDLINAVYNPETIADYTEARTQISTDYVKSLIGERFGMKAFATDEYDEDFVTEVVRNAVMSEIMGKTKDGKNRIKSTYGNYTTDKNGNEIFESLNMDAITMWIANYLRGYVGNTEAMIAAEDEKGNVVYPFYVDQKNGEARKGFTSMQLAKDFVVKNKDKLGITMDDIYREATGDDHAYSNAQNAIDALIQQRKEENAAVALNDFLYGKTYNEGKDNEYKIKGLTDKSFKSIQDVLDEYDTYGLNNEFANMLANNADLLSLYYLNKNGQINFEEFQAAAEKLTPGRSSASSIYDAVLKMVTEGGKESVEKGINTLRTDDQLSGAYKIFKDIGGDAVDAYMNAILEGADAAAAEAKKAMDKNAIENKIKEKFQFREGFETFSKYATTAMFGSESEQMSQNQDFYKNATDFNSYNAAVNRYVNGEAREQDFSIIASKSQYSETDLRTKYGQEDVKNAVANERDVTQRQLTSNVQNMLEAMLSSEGLTLKDVAAGKKQILKKTGTTFKYAGLENVKNWEDTVAALAAAGYTIDKDGNIQYSGEESEMNIVAALAQSSRQQQESNLQPIWSALSSASDEVLTDRTGNALLQWGKTKGFTDAQMTQLASNETFLNYLFGGASADQMKALASRLATGKQGTFAGNYDTWMKQLFGEDWSTGNLDMDKAKTEFARARSLEDQSLYNMYVGMLGSVSGGSVIQEILAGGTGDLETATKQFYEQLATEKYADQKNGAEIAQLSTTLKYGTDKEKMQAASSYLDQLREQQRAQAAFDKIYSRDTSEYFGSAGGNINLNGRTVVKNPDGSYSTDQSFSIGVDGKQVLIPRVIGGEVVSEPEAIRYYYETGENFGSFNTIEEAQQYAVWMHQRNDERYKEGNVPNRQYNTAENRSIIAQTLGISESDVKDIIDKGDEGAKILQQMIDDGVENLQDTIVKSIAELLDIDVSDVIDNGEVLDKALESADESIRQLANKLLEVSNFGAESGKIKGADDKKTLDEAYTEAKQRMAEGLNDTKGFNWLSENMPKMMKERFQSEGQNKTLEQIMKEMSTDEYGNDKTGVDWERFMQENAGAAMMLGLREKGEISEKELDNFLQNSIVGGEKTTGYYDAIAGGLFGTFFNEDSGVFDIDSSNFEEFWNMISNFEGFEDTALDEFINKYSQLQEVINNFRTGNIKAAKEALRDLNNQMRADRANEIKKYGDQTEYVNETLSQISKGGKSAAQAVASFASKANKLQDQKTAINKAKGKSGKQLDKTTQGVIADMLNISADDVKNMTKDQLKNVLDEAAQGTDQEFSNMLQGFVDQVMSHAKAINLDLGQIDVNSDGKIDLKELQEACKKTGDEAIAKILAMAGQYGKVTFKTTKNGDSLIVTANVDAKKKYNSGGGGGGGGGSKKSAADKLLEKQKREDAVSDHQVKMSEYIENYYEERGELTIYGKAMQNTKKVRENYSKQLEKQIKQLRNQMSHTKKGSEDWYKLRDAIFAAEEKLKENNNTIDATNKKLKENRSAIRQTRIEVEQAVKTEIETRIQEQRDQLEGRASMEQTVLNIIQERYRKEWDRQVPTNRIAGTP